MYRTPCDQAIQIAKVLIRLKVWIQSNQSSREGLSHPINSDKAYSFRQTEPTRLSTWPARLAVFKLLGLLWLALWKCASHLCHHTTTTCQIQIKCCHSHLQRGT